MAEKPLLTNILLKVSALKCRLFRNNVGTGWVGKVVGKKAAGGGVRLVLEDARPLHAGLIKGSSDLIGWTCIEITGEMVGTTVAVFTAIEVKTPGTKTQPHQKTFLDNVRNSGGISGIAHTVEEAIEIIRNG